MAKFSERLVQAARHAGVGETQAEIASDLGLKRQTVHHWFSKDGVPESDTLALIEKRWGVDGEWLRSGDGTMLPQPSPEDLRDDELELLRDYRKASMPTREHIRTVVRALRKSMVTIAAVLPPLLAPAPADAAIYHNSFSGLNTHWLRRLLAALCGPLALTH